MKDYRKYSGDASRLFWKRIHALGVKGVTDRVKHQDVLYRDELYQLGEMLQRLEEYVLERLAKAEGQR